MARTTLIDDVLATGLAIAGETLERAVDGEPGSLQRVTAALADIRRFAPMLEPRARLAISHEEDGNPARRPSGPIMAQTSMRSL